MEGHKLLRSAALDEYRKNPNFVRDMEEEPGPHPSLYPGFKYEGHSWGNWRAQIKDILLYHVTAGRRSADWLSDRSQITMLNGDVAMIDGSMGVTVDGAKVLLANVPASNGFIHVVDTVLLPPAYS